MCSKTQLQNIIQKYHNLIQASKAALIKPHEMGKSFICKFYIRYTSITTYFRNIWFIKCLQYIHKFHWEDVWIKSAIKPIFDSTEYIRFFLPIVLFGIIWENIWIKCNLNKKQGWQHP